MRARVFLKFTRRQQRALRRVVLGVDVVACTADFSSLEVNPKIAGDAFDLPKNAKRVKMN